MITTVAGSGVYGDSGDGGPATSAAFMGMSGLAVDALGHVYITDSQAHRVRQVDTVSGLGITTAAGTGVYGSGEATGDGGPASLAPLSTPFGIAGDGAGNLVVSEERRVRHVSSEVAPRFTSNGEDASVLTNAAVAFSVGYAGLPEPAVVWQVSTDAGQTFADLAEAPPYSGVNTAALSISAAPFTFNGYLYRAPRDQYVGGGVERAGVADRDQTGARHHVVEPGGDPAWHGARWHPTERRGQRAGLVRLRPAGGNDAPGRIGPPVESDLHTRPIPPPTPGSSRT